jgi:hypothetical protein
VTWVPEDCTLPTADQPLRVDEFEALFAEAVQSVEAASPTLVRLVLDGSGAVEARARDLAARETSCCSFFAFDFDHDDEGRLLMSVSVPETHAEILRALAGRAAEAAGSISRAAPSGS